MLLDRLFIFLHSQQTIFILQNNQVSVSINLFMVRVVNRK